MSLYGSISDLTVDIESVRVRTNEQRVSEDFVRKTSTVVLAGRGETGLGEDVIYDPSFHRYPDSLADELTGRWTVDGFSDAVGRLELFEPDQEVDTDGRGFRDRATKERFRRWAVESAALDLALKQDGTDLATALGHEYDPVRFVVSPSLDEQDAETLSALIDAVPGIEFKLNAMAEWDRETTERIASLERTQAVDFKGYYDNVGVDPDYELYETVAAVFEDAILEDPKLTDDTRSAFAGHEDRLAWDKPITGVDSLSSLPVEPTRMNVKPARFGSVESLLDTIEYCRDSGIALYGGGQFELDVGRQHVQALASIFYPDAPNDIAPSEYNESGIPNDPPRSPLTPAAELRGLHWY